MKAFVYTRKATIEKKDIPDAGLDPGRREDGFAAVLRPRFLSPCSSDVHTVFAGDGPRRADLVLGHEGLAEILEVGDQVRDFRPGELVAVSPVMPDPGDDTGHAGTPFSGMKLGRSMNGMWSERFKIPDADRNLAHIPEGVTTEAALMAADTMATGYTAAAEAGIEPGHTVVIIGSGAVGLMAAEAAGAMAGENGRIIMIGSDRDTVSYGLARDFGTDIYISYRDGRVLYADEMLDLSPFPERDARANYTGSPAVDAVFRCTGGYGADRVLICGGDALAAAQACDMVRYGSGVVVNMAYIEGGGTVGLPVFSLGRGMSGKTFKFILSRGGRNWTERMLSIAAARGSAEGRMVTHRLQGFDAVPEALGLMRQRPAGLVKVMVEV